jgi:hypothetical protein
MPGATTETRSAVPMRMRAQRVRSRVPRNPKRRKMYPPRIAWSGYAMVAAPMTKGGGADGLEIKARNQDEAIGSHMRYPPRYTAATAMPVGMRITAGLVSKWKKRY